MSNQYTITLEGGQVFNNVTIEPSLVEEPTPNPEEPAPEPVGPQSVSISATRTTGPAPLGLTLTATATGFGVENPRHDLMYFWRTDDTGEWSALSDNMVLSRSKAERTGFSISHTYDTPGTYTVEVMATDGVNDATRNRHSS